MSGVFTQRQAPLHVMWPLKLNPISSMLELQNSVFSLNNFQFGLLFREDRMERYEGCFIFAIFSEKALQELSSIAMQRFMLANMLPVPK